MYIVIGVEDEKWEMSTFPEIKPDTYMISNYGRIINSKFNRPVKGRLDADGYHRASLRSSKGGNYYVGVHKLVGWQFCDGYDEEHGVVVPNHLDCNRSHNYYKNIAWTTHSGNRRHGLEHGMIRGIRGERNNLTQYKEVQIRESCRLREQGYSAKEIEKITGVNHNYLHEIFSGKKWKGISDDYTLKLPRVRKFKGFSTDLKTKIIKLLIQGYKPKEICKKLNINYNKTHKDAITNLRKNINKQSSTTIENDEYYTIDIH